MTKPKCYKRYSSEFKREAILRADVRAFNLAEIGTEALPAKRGPRTKVAKPSTDSPDWASQGPRAMLPRPARAGYHPGRRSLVISYPPHAP